MFKARIQTLKNLKNLKCVILKILRYPYITLEARLNGFQVFKCRIQTLKNLKNLKHLNILILKILRYP